MTGQVKEELLTRWAELGLVVSEGSIHFSSVLFSEAELRIEAGTLVHLDVAGRPHTSTCRPELQPSRSVVSPSSCPLPTRHR